MIHIIMLTPILWYTILGKNYVMYTSWNSTPNLASVSDFFNNQIKNLLQNVDIVIERFNEARHMTVLHFHYSNVT